MPSTYDGVAVQVNDGSGWGDAYGPFTSYSKQKISGLKSDTDYQVRTFYYKMTTYNGQSYPMYGPFATTTVKTGKSSKPAVKSISVKYVKTFTTKLHRDGYWDAFGKWNDSYDGTGTNTKYKITVKLKKKLGIKGLYINGKLVKGNKTTYTATFSEPGKLKGKKVTVMVASCNDLKVGAYSATLKKKVKMK